MQIYDFAMLSQNIMTLFFQYWTFVSYYAFLFYFYSIYYHISYHILLLYPKYGIFVKN